MVMVLYIKDVAAMAAENDIQPMKRSISRTRPSTNSSVNTRPVSIYDCQVLFVINYYYHYY